MWDEIGRLQLDHLLRLGLKPHMRLIDIGCGCLRGGIHLVRHLDPGNYFGLDSNRSLLDAGYSQEITVRNLRNRLPKSNLLHDKNFRVDRFGVNFEFALAFSLFTHLPLNHIKLCLVKLAACMVPRGKFLATFFESPPNHDWTRSRTQNPGGVVTWPDQDPYHYKMSDLNWCIQDQPWRLERLENQDHPRGQIFILFSLAS